jgi:hypothetical protein
MSSSGFETKWIRAAEAITKVSSIKPSGISWVAVASLWNRHCAGSSARNSDTQVREETWQDVGFFSETPQNGAWVAESHGRFAFEH